MSGRCVESRKVGVLKAERLVEKQTSRMVRQGRSEREGRKSGTVGRLKGPEDPQD